jgi:hypothetical protein
VQAPLTLTVDRDQDGCRTAIVHPDVGHLLLDAPRLHIEDSDLEMVNAGRDDQPGDQGVARMQTGAWCAIAIRSFALLCP